MALKTLREIGLAEPEDDLDRLRALTPSERLALVEQACRLAAYLLRGRPDVAEVLARHEEPAPQARATWERLVRETRSARAR